MVPPMDLLMAVLLHGWSSWEPGAAPFPVQAGSTVRGLLIVIAIISLKYANEYAV